MTRSRRRWISPLVVIVVGLGLVVTSVTLATARYAESAPAPEPARSSASGTSPAQGHHQGAASATASTPASTSAAPGSDATSTPSAPILGLYAGPGAVGTTQAVDQELGGRVADVFDFLPYTSWTTLTNPSWLAADWQGTSYAKILGIPMLPTSGGTMAAGAAGAYAPEFGALAARLVADGLATATLLIGWQPDDPGTPWSVASAADAAHYVDYWDEIESTMAATPGSHFVFEWDAGDARTSAVTPTQTYPGDDAVDVVATDAFDSGYAGLPAGEQWTALHEQAYGPGWMAEFAAAHGKPMALAMWGPVPKAAGGSGDNPTFAVQLLRWAAATHLVSCVLWDYGEWATMGGAFPATAAALRQWYGGTPGG